MEINIHSSFKFNLIASILAVVSLYSNSEVLLLSSQILLAKIGPVETLLPNIAIQILIGLLANRVLGMDVQMKRPPTSKKHLISYFVASIILGYVLHMMKPRGIDHFTLLSGAIGLIIIPASVGFGMEFGTPEGKEWLKILLVNLLGYLIGRYTTQFAIKKIKGVRSNYKEW